MIDEPTCWKQLEESIRGLYRTFARYKLDGPILCEMTDRIIVPDDIPLRGRTAVDFDRYESKAITTLGSVEDYKHFLPRLLELSTEAERCHSLGKIDPTSPNWHVRIHIDMIAMKLTYAKAAELWPMDELEALAAFGVARLRWEFALQDAYDIQYTLEFLEAVGRPAAAVLWAMIDTEDADAISLLCRVMSDQMNHLLVMSRKHRLTSQANRNAFNRWLLERSLPGRISDAFFRFDSTVAAKPLSDVLTQLEWLQAAMGATNP